ncbi:hypothetical protein R69608_06724 [Paraburkholderia nemoris]|uniref:Clp R domain-containing protein n=1 Tax=Paraburkholderia nemoris TaxID=2793076 RepID=A0ABM8T0M0_9BURK|nr:hypothetical protein R75777_07264 [Paraburkholderia nemoris]CAE6845124.1 hypothetical protein R69776_07227 [Paraburkholderia nemoris]CAE6964241.1 hypothetical protein R69608_06724 [Paraburkholderia nemoris]
MMTITRHALFGKLGSTLFKSVESATTLCKLRGNPYVELVHWLHQILQLSDSDLHRILRHCEIDLGSLERDMTRALGVTKRFLAQPSPYRGRVWRRSSARRPSGMCFSQTQARRN